MKTGRTLVELAREIERQAETKKDYAAPTAMIRAYAEPRPDAEPAVGLTLATEAGDKNLAVTDLAHEQLGEWAGIPRAYYKRCLAEQPQCLVEQLNTWLKAKPATRLVRTLDGRVRAFLSNGYRPLDYSDMAEAVFPVLSGLGVEIMSCEITERRLYIKAVDRRIEKDVPTGARMKEGHVFFDTLSPAIVISNSEVGSGALSVETAVWTKVCTNLCIASERSIRKYHLGARHLADGVEEIITDASRRKADEALWAVVRDVVSGAFDRAKFDAVADHMAGTAKNAIGGDPVKAVEVVGKRMILAESEKTSVLRHLIAGGDLTQYGLFNAVTRAAEDVPSYDRATELEKIGGRIVDLEPTEWREIAEAA